MQRGGQTVSRYCAALVSPRGKFEGSHPCCGVVSNGCCDVSALRGALAGYRAPAPPKPAIACTSWASAADPVGEAGAKPLCLRAA